MRLLNKEEQEFCNRILKGNDNNNFLGNIISYKLNQVSVVFQPTGIVEFHHNIKEKGNPTDEEIKRDKDVTKIILNAVNLIQLLEKENYIMLIQRAINPFDKFGSCIDSLPCYKSKLNDPNISKLLVEYANKEIYITEEFNQFCKNKFISREEQRFRKEICITRSAFLVTFLALCVTVFFNLIQLTNKPEINKEQLDILVTTFSHLENKLDTLNLLNRKILQKASAMENHQLNKLKTINHKPSYK